jgi:hypothetical protein
MLWKSGKKCDCGKATVAETDETISQIGRKSKNCVTGIIPREYLRHEAKGITFQYPHLQNLIFMPYNI